MVVERFRDGNARPVYERAREQGRMLPPGLRYVDSWVEAGFGRCFQLMECDDLTLLAAWIARWADLVEFEVIPVMTSAQASTVLQPDTDGLPAGQG
ncbi:DUF3303 domain-containing protein [Catellatospora vulcania]|uniref:DUF3303 domain-containing protein n=1 Tax=Catellatospora vulcania TaxID=1460450 RepID=UPI001E2E1498|nr:DUF3303 family protein [Catellatospora vulcania]